MKKRETSLFAKAFVMGSVFMCLVFPALAFAQSDVQIRSSLVQQLITIFVAEVNGIDSMLSLTAQSANPAQFADFNTQLHVQLSNTTSQLATLLNPSSSNVQVQSLPAASAAPVSTSTAPTGVTITTMPPQSTAPVVKTSNYADSIPQIQIWTDKPIVPEKTTFSAAGQPIDETLTVMQANVYIPVDDCVGITCGTYRTFITLSTHLPSNMGAVGVAIFDADNNEGTFNVLR